MDFFNNLILSSENLKSNLKTIKKQVGLKKICAMVKANAYGHDLKFVVLNLKHDVDFFGVANCFEALEVRRYAQKNKILVCGKVSKENIKTMIEKNISLTVYSIKNLIEIINICKKEKLKSNIHIKLNTGMNRLGVKNKSTFLKMLDKINKNKRYINLEGVYSHLFNSENLGLSHTQYNQFLNLLNCINIYNKLFLNKNKNKQKIGKFIKNRRCKLLNIYASKNCENGILQKPYEFKNLIVHLENSAGIFNNVDYLNVCNMVRTGIALYGLEIKNKGLKPVLSLNSKIVQIQKVREEDYVGYGKVIMEKDGKVAVVPIGYADGIIKAYKNQIVYVNNSPCKILNVCMDSILIDVTSCSAKVGDDVCLISQNMKNQNSVNLIAKNLNTISYEIVTNLHHNRMNIIYK